MTITEFDQRISQYVKSVLIPSCQSSLRKFALGAVVGTGRLSLRVLPADLLATLGVAGADDVDVDALQAAAAAGMDAAGELYVPVLGLHFTKEDVDRFFGYVRTGVVGRP